MTKTWLVHSYHNAPKDVGSRRAKALLAKYGGSYAWVDDVCHVYLLPTVEADVRQRGQAELDAFARPHPTCPEREEGEPHSFTADMEYDSTGQTINCEHCGEEEP